MTEAQILAGLVKLWCSRVIVCIADAMEEFDERLSRLEEQLAPTPHAEGGAT
jgi:hypothetical protein